MGALAEHDTFPPFLPEPRSSALLKFQPRLGFVYTLPGERTVIRGGSGKYFPEMDDTPNRVMSFATQVASVTVPNDGRPDFAANPFNGPPPTFAEASRGIGQSPAIMNPDLRSPYSWQSAVGIQRQIGGSMAIEADFVHTGGRREHNNRNANLSYDPATGVNYPFSDLSRRPYPDWSAVTMTYSDGWSNLYSLQTAFTKRLSGRWQLSANYTLSWLKNATGAPTGPCFIAGALGPCPEGFRAAPDLGGEYTLSETDQRHRAVVNGIWQLPYAFQLSGLYFFGSGERYSPSYGANLRNTGPGGAGRLRLDGSLVPRNDFVGDPVHRVDLRVLREFSPYRNIRIDGIVEVFNVLNHANYGSYVTVETSPAYGRPQQNIATAYQPRSFQLGFRMTF
jgi:hypothetical protein